MQSMYYVGLDVHKKTISYCVKDASGHIRLEGTIASTPTRLPIACAVIFFLSLKWPPRRFELNNSSLFAVILLRLSSGTVPLSTTLVC